WPNSENVADFKFIYLVHEDHRVFVTYEGHSSSGKGFRNTEILTIRHGQLVEAEVYFGWSLPHEAPSGGFTNPGPQAVTSGARRPRAADPRRTHRCSSSARTSASVAPHEAVVDAQHVFLADDLEAKLLVQENVSVDVRLQIG